MHPEYYMPPDYDAYRDGFGMGQVSLWDLIDRLTVSPVDAQYSTCHFCGNFLTIRRRDGKPIERGEYGYPLQTPENTDLVVDPYDGHKDNCAWMAARRFRGDNNIKAQEPS